MFRSFPILLACTALAACGSSESRPEREGVADTATMVVPSDALVPSTDPVVVFLGTSLTAGMGVQLAESYPSVLRAMADSAGLPFRLLNAGVSGETSAGGLRRLDWALRDPVDVLFVELGANDGLRGQDPAAMAENLTEIVRRTRSRYPDAEVLLARMEAPPNLGEAYTTAFRAVYPAVAEAEGARLVPFLLDGVAGVPELNQPDRIHPNPEGHRRTAENVWPHLETVLRSLQETP